MASTFDFDAAWADEDAAAAGDDSRPVVTVLGEQVTLPQFLPYRVVHYLETAKADPDRARRDAKRSDVVDLLASFIGRDRVDAVMARPGTDVPRLNRMLWQLVDLYRQKYRPANEEGE